MVEAISETGPGPMVTAVGDGMEALATTMSEGGDLAAGGDAFMAVMQDAVEGGAFPGVTPDMMDTMADSFGDVAGPAMMGIPADCSPADMAEVFTDAAQMMMPEGFEMPPEMSSMFEGMADTFVDAGVGPHDVAAEFGPPLPDGAVPGDPSSFPDAAFGDPGDVGMAPPPVLDGPDMAGGTQGDMAGGPQDGMAPPPNDVAGGPQDGMAPPPVLDGPDMAGGIQGDMAGGAADGGAGALGAALGQGSMDMGPSDGGANAGAMAFEQGDPAAAAAADGSAADAAIGAAMDSQMEQGGAPEAATGNESTDVAGAQDMGTSDEVDPSAGMG
jgi:hypothetical protein